MGDNRKMNAKRLALFLTAACCIGLCGCAGADGQPNRQAETTTAPKQYENFDKNEAADSMDESPWLLDENGDKLLDENGQPQYDTERAEQILRAQGFFITMNDFYVEEDDGKPLPVSHLNHAKYSEMFSLIDGMMWISDDSFRLYHLIDYDEWASFRGFVLDGEQHYYCIFENDDGEKGVSFLCSVSNDMGMSPVSANRQVRQSNYRCRQL